MDQTVGYLMIALAIIMLVGLTIYWSIKDSRAETEHKSNLNQNLDRTLIIQEGWYKS